MIHLFQFGVHTQMVYGKWKVYPRSYVLNAKLLKLSRNNFYQHSEYVGSYLFKPTKNDLAGVITLYSEYIFLESLVRFNRIQEYENAISSKSKTFESYSNNNRCLEYFQFMHTCPMPVRHHLLAIFWSPNQPRQKPC